MPLLYHQQTLPSIREKQPPPPPHTHTHHPHLPLRNHGALGQGHASATHCMTEQACTEMMSKPDTRGVLQSSACSHCPPLHPGHQKLGNRSPAQFCASPQTPTAHVCRLGLASERAWRRVWERVWASHSLAQHCLQQYPSCRGACPVCATNHNHHNQSRHLSHNHNHDYNRNHNHNLLCFNVSCTGGSA